ncbi:MAG: 4'-phosphopantetheinyl transferase superfamily protein [Bacteroidia bacterium]|nr:4'-phosphopantetheinyl transferase superfamily protein [Bacteroidia bacterium]
MPLVKMQKTAKQSGWAIWFIAESMDELTRLSPEPCPAEIVSAQKRLEWLAGRTLIKTLVEHSGLEYHGLRKDEFGKPFLNNYTNQISLTHSHPYVAAQIDIRQSVGIDLEQPKEKLLKIAHRIMADYELADAGQDIVKHCVYWCAKEALYKIYGRRGLTFLNHLNIEPFTLRNFGDLKGRIESPENEMKVDLCYSIQPDYVLVFTNTNAS